MGYQPIPDVLCGVACGALGFVLVMSSRKLQDGGEVERPEINIASDVHDGVEWFSFWEVDAPDAFIISTVVEQGDFR